MFELHVSDKNVSTGSVAIGWCVSKETLDTLHAAGNKTPHVVLILAPVGDAYEPSKEIRKIVPLKDLVAYLDFNRSGEMKIWGFIAEDPSAKYVKDRWLDRSANQYSYSILLNSGEDYALAYKDAAIEYADSISVIIPEQAFAAPPAEWEKNWVNHFFSKKPEDQCSFRRRRMFAYTVQPVLLFLDLIVKMFITLFALLWGTCDLTLAPLVQPYTHFYNLCGDEGLMFQKGTVFLGKSENVLWNFARLPFMPLVAVPLFFIIRAIIISGSLFKALMIVGSVLLLVGLVAGAVVLYEEWQRAEEAKEAWYLNDNEINLIVCSGQQKPFTLKQLPRNHRTFRLRFRALKSQVCRPFAK